MCMKNIGVECEHTEDEKGQQRFIGMDVQTLATFTGREAELLGLGLFYKRMYDFWGKDTGEYKFGANLMSDQNTGFHRLRSPSSILRMYALLYPMDACPNESKLVQSFLAYQANYGFSND